MSLMLQGASIVTYLLCDLEEGLDSLSWSVLSGKWEKVTLLSHCLLKYLTRVGHRVGAQ